MPGQLGRSGQVGVGIRAVLAAGLWWGSLAAAANCGEPKSLFDGKTLQGWQGDSNYWRVDQGAIVGEIPPGQTLAKNTWLVWQNGELADFDLRLKFRITGTAAANSGIQFRCQVRDVDHVAGYQADLDLGQTWLGRIYDEHGRALLVERGQRVRIHPDGSRESETFAPRQMYPVLFRENQWNDYRIVAVGEHIALFINGTLFSELYDQEQDQRDLRGQLALQLHSGPQTRVEFRDIQLQELGPHQSPLKPFTLSPKNDSEEPTNRGLMPRSADGRELNLGLETGDLSDWAATGDAFDGQPVEQDGISQRWPGQTSNKAGSHFIGGFEVVGDRGTGTLTSVPFPATHPYASFLIGGGQADSTRVEVLLGKENAPPEVMATASGRNREQMRRVVVDLRDHQGQAIAVRLVDDYDGAWGHLNFDDFRFHENKPEFADAMSHQRSTFNPILQHLVRNPKQLDPETRGEDTASQMFVPQGFSVDVIAAEPALHQPIAFAFDARGRIWVAEGHSYPQKRAPGEGLDRILIFADENGDGHYETRKVFAEGLNLVSGLAVGYGGVFVGAAPQLLFIPDRDNNDRPDRDPIVLLDGFGYADTHETLNSFMWGPDGWLYGNQGIFNRSAVGKPGTSDQQRQILEAGVWRYHPTRDVFEIFAHGGSNQWGLDFDDLGQFFMTTCRSYWGRGATTHVIQGGHYWNQNNAGFAPFLTSRSHPALESMPNYLLASARYGHGEGGAGKPGSREVYGGHAHVGTMVYLGDNWPSRFRNHLFTHNLHGHQINHQINHRDGSGFHTVHAGQDVLFCADPQYVAVELKYGPDGAVYFSDWYDPRHCHNPNAEEWDRGNGRLYRLQYDATFQPTVVDYQHAPDIELAAAQLHGNDWHVRTARRVLAERASRRPIDDPAIGQLTTLLNHADAARRLRGMWALHAASALDPQLLAQLFRDPNESVRGWAIQLAAEAPMTRFQAAECVRMASDDPSLLVCRYLTSALTRISVPNAWDIIEGLAVRSDVASDPKLVRMLWYGLAPLLTDDIERGLRLADATALPDLRDYVNWYLARSDDQGRERVFARLLGDTEEATIEELSLLALAVGDLRGPPAPKTWDAVASQLYRDERASIRNAAESIGAAFKDKQLYRSMRERLGDANATIAARRQALQVLAADEAPENVPRLLNVLDDAQLAHHAIPLLSRYAHSEIAEQLLDRLVHWNDPEQAAALEVLSGRVEWSHRLLDRVDAGVVPRQLLTAYYVQRMAGLGDDRLNERIQRQWGALRQSPAELRAEIEAITAAYQSAPRWAYSAQAGAQHFDQLCRTCHAPDQQTETLGPRLQGSGSKGIAYLVENVVDPNAVIGRDYLAQVIVTVSGQMITGIIEAESDSSLTIRTATHSVTVSKDDIEAMRVSDKSFMPEGLLKTLNDRQRIELFKYLMTL